MIKTELVQFIDELRRSDGSGECPIRMALDTIGGRWKLRILSQMLRYEKLRFNELKRNIIGITNTMLACSLKELEAAKLITRIQYNEMPLRVEYSLTEVGISILPVLFELSKWWRHYQAETLTIQ